MEGLQPREIEDLLQQLEEEYGAEESFRPQVDDLLRDLRAGNTSTRLEAAHRLGKVSASSTAIVQALLMAQESDINSTVRWYAADSLRAPVHQESLEQHPDLMKRAQALNAEAAVAKRARQESEQRAERRASQAAREASARSFFSVLLALLGAALGIRISGDTNG